MEGFASLYHVHFNEGFSPKVTYVSMTEFKLEILFEALKDWSWEADIHLNYNYMSSKYYPM